MRKDENNPRPEGFKLPEEMNARLRIEQFVDKVTRVLYNNSTDPVGLGHEKGRSSLVSMFAGDLKELEDSFKAHSEVPGMITIPTRFSRCSTHSFEE